MIDSLVKEHVAAYGGAAMPKVALITGGTSGLGKVIARAVAEAGFHVILPVRNRTKGEAVRMEILAQVGTAKITLMDCDLASLASVKRFADQFKAMNLPLHLLVSNTRGSSCCTHAA